MDNEQVDQLAAAITKIAHGPISGPTGLEAVAMALSTAPSGNGGNTVSDALMEVAAAVDRLAEAVEGKNA